MTEATQPLRHAVLGAGAIGATLSLMLAARGHEVTLMTRSGSGPEHPRIRRLSGDASSAGDVERAIVGAAALHCCVHPGTYSAAAWRRETPPVQAAVLAAAGRAGIPVVFTESLYSMDRGEQPFTEPDGVPALPEAGLSRKGMVRRRLIEERMAARTRVVSMVASDYFGPHALQNAHAGERMMLPAIQGGTARPIGSADLPHSFTYLPDLAAAMIRAAEMPEASGVLFAPTGPPVTQRELIAAYCRAAGTEMPRLAPLPSWAMRAGRFVPPLGEFAEMLYQWENPYVMDSSRTERLLGLRPTPLLQAVEETVAWWRERLQDAA